jgi:hypothetical protein
MSKHASQGICLTRGQGHPSPVGASYALELEGQRLLVAEGEHLIGRAVDCSIILDGELVSRRHARLTVTGAAVFVEDLGSVNGVTVNGDVVQGKTLVAPDSLIGIAGIDLKLLHRSRSQAHQTQRAPAPHVGRRDSGVDLADHTQTDARRLRAFELLSRVVEKALAMGQSDEAERVMGALLREVLEDANVRGGLMAELAEFSAKRALDLAVATKKSEWISYPVRLYLATGDIVPMFVVDELHSLARVPGALEPLLLSSYLEVLEGRRSSPADRFVVQRLRTLQRMIASAPSR